MNYIARLTPTGDRQAVTERPFWQVEFQPQMVGRFRTLLFDSRASRKMASRFELVAVHLGTRLLLHPQCGGISLEAIASLRCDDEAGPGVPLVVRAVARVDPCELVMVARFDEPRAAMRPPPKHAFCACPQCVSTRWAR